MIERAPRDFPLAGATAAVAAGSYVMVHARPQSEKGTNPGVACGDLSPAGQRVTR